ncbi:MAG TPA: hypothetical protein VJC12_00070 [Candidatus Paceibacterota bacterium]
MKVKLFVPHDGDEGWGMEFEAETEEERLVIGILRQNLHSLFVENAFDDNQSIRFQANPLFR